MRSRLSEFAVVSFLAMLLVIFVAVPRAQAQSTTDGAIGGTVTDQSGAVVPNAVVASHNLGTGRSSSGVTDGSGRYLLIHLQPGLYSLEISGTGFGVFKATNITVEVGRVTTIDTTLSVKAVTETVVATAELPVITTDSADFTPNINQTTIDNLPINGRRWSTFALLSPGAVPDGGFGLVSFRGISGLLNNNTVDGADNNQAFFSEERGRTRISYSTSEAAIQEFQINTSNYSAEYGRSAGGVVNAVTKSGSNQLHGQAFWYDRTSDFGAINPFSFKAVSGGSRVPFLPPDKRHQFGGGIGGPVVNDKLFFFFSGDQQLRGFPAIADSGNPGAIVAPLTPAELGTLSGRRVSAAQASAGLAFLQSLTGEVPRTGNQLILLPKIDWNITSKHHVSVSYNRLRWASPAGVQTAGVVSRGIESFGSDYVKEDWGIARLTSSFSTAFSNELRYQIGRDFEFQIGQNPVSGEPASAQGVSPQVFIGGVGNFTFGKPNFLDRRAFPKEMRNQIADTLSWSHGTHFLRFGFDFNHVNDVEDNLFRESGDISYGTRADYLSDFAAAVNKMTPRCTFTPAPPKPPVPVAVPCYSSFNQQLGPSKFTFSTNDLAFFVQDDWRLQPYFTVNLGLRYETELMPSPQIANPALPLSRKFPNDFKDFGPRLGFAWDLTHNGKTIVRGGYGIFYGRIINSTIANAITNTGVLSSAQLGFFFLPSDPGAPIYPNVLATAPPPASFTPQVVEFAPHTSNPMVHEFDLDFQREIAPNTVVSVSYLGSLGGNLPRFVDINLNPPASTVTYTFSGGSQNGQTLTVPLFLKGPRPNPSFNSITDISNSVTSKYNALVVALNRRFYQGFQIQTSFTYSHANDAGQSSQTFTVSNNVLNPFDLTQEQGRSNFDIRERFNVGAVWTPDLYKGSRLILKELVNGFTISPLIAISAGAPYTALLQNNAPGGVSSGILGAGGTNRLPGLLPNAFQMPRTANVDLRLEKSFRLTERRTFTLTADAFNALNHTNFTAVDNQIYTICSANAKCSATGLTPTVNQLVFNNHFGVPTSSSNSLLAQRQIQIGARLDF